jgi:hypothetical protein
VSGELERRVETLPAPRGGPLVPGEWEQLSRIAKTIAATEFVPKGLRGNGHGVMACILYGRDQGLSPMVALSEIHMVDGKPTMSAALIAGKVRLAGHKISREAVYDGQGHVVGITAHGERTDGTRDSFTFTLDMARRAGLAGKTNWKNYPEAMLWARACTQLARMLFSDVFIGSVYTADEMGAETDEDGAVLHGEIVDEGSAATGAADTSGDTEPQAGADESATSPVSAAEEAGRASTPVTDGQGAAAASGGQADPRPSFQAPSSVPVQKPASAAQKKALNALIGRVREQANRVTTAELWAFVGRTPDTPEDGEHFAPLRESLTLHEASELIEHLKTLEEFAIADGALEPRRAA